MASRKFGTELRLARNSLTNAARRDSSSLSLYPLAGFRIWLFLVDLTTRVIQITTKDALEVYFSRDVLIDCSFFALS